MKHWIIIKEDIKKQKGVYIGITVLTFIITAVLFAVMGFYGNSKNYIEEQMNRVGYGDVMSCCLAMKDSKIDALEREINDVEGVARVNNQQIVTVAEVTIQDRSMDDLQMFLPYVKGKADSFYIYNHSMSGIEKNPEILKPGEIYIPPSLKLLYGLNIGEKIKITLNKQGETLDLTVKGYFEDPVMGSSMMGMKTILLSQEDYDSLVGLASKESTYVYIGASLHIYKEKDLSTLEFCNRINEETSINDNNSFLYTKESVSSFMMILQNIFSGLLLFFVIVLAAVSIGVVAHSISMGIEQDYTDMGIEKAIGFTSRELKKIQYMQYMLAVGVGIVAGTIASFFLIRLINRVLLTITGILVPEDLPFIECMIAIAGYVIILLAVIALKVRKITKVSPIKAIRRGISDVYFQSRISPRIRKKGFSFWITLRQLTSGKRQYIGVIIVSLLLVYILSMVSRINNFIGVDGQGIMQSMSSYCYEGKSYDFSIESRTVTEEEISDIVKKYSAITKVMHAKRGEGITINDHSCMINVCDSPEVFQMTKGKTCRYDNEVVITQNIAKLLDVNIGDNVVLKFEDKANDYIVSGIYQCSNDLGDNFGMSMEGYQQLKEDQSKPAIFYFLEDRDQKEAIVKELTNLYGDEVALELNDWSGLDGLVNSLDAVMIFMYVVVIVFTLITCILSGNRILFRETHDIGVYKSIGYTSGKLRSLFALRFFITSVLGGVGGIIVGAAIVDKIANYFMSSFGIYGFESHLNNVELLIPGVIVSLLFTIFAYLVARKIKKVSPEVLISE